MGGNVQTPGVDYLRKAFRWRQNEGSKLWTRRFYAASFSTAAVTNVIDITTFVGGSLIEGAFIALIQNFAGGGAGSATFSLGTTAGPTIYINAANVFTGAAANQPLMRAGVTLVPGTPLNLTNPAAAGTVRFTLTSDVNLSLLTTGVLDVFIRLRVISLRPSAV